VSYSANLSLYLLGVRSYSSIFLIFNNQLTTLIFLSIARAAVYGKKRRYSIAKPWAKSKINSGIAEVPKPFAVSSIDSDIAEVLNETRYMGTGPPRAFPPSRAFTGPGSNPNEQMDSSLSLEGDLDGVSLNDDDSELSYGHTIL